ncbi:hypothetical protein BKA80DRAFT_283556 [Phyllosticta citrichinensis]
MVVPVVVRVVAVRVVVMAVVATGFALQRFDSAFQGVDDLRSCRRVLKSGQGGRRRPGERDDRERRESVDVVGETLTLVVIRGGGTPDPVRIGLAQLVDFGLLVAMLLVAVAVIAVLGVAELGRLRDLSTAGGSRLSLRRADVEGNTPRKVSNGRRVLAVDGQVLDGTGSAGAVAGAVQVAPDVDDDFVEGLFGVVVDDGRIKDDAVGRRDSEAGDFSDKGTRQRIKNLSRLDAGDRGGNGGNSRQVLGRTRQRQGVRQDRVRGQRGPVDARIEARQLSEAVRRVEVRHRVWQLDGADRGDQGGHGGAIDGRDLGDERRELRALEDRDASRHGARESQGGEKSWLHVGRGYW